MRFANLSAFFQKKYYISDFKGIRHTHRKNVLAWNREREGIEIVNDLLNSRILVLDEDAPVAKRGSGRLKKDKSDE